MSTISVRLPDSLHSMAKDLAKKDKTSLNQLIVSAISEKISALNTEEYLSERAERGSREKFLNALKSVPKVEPSDEDKL